MKYEQKLKDRVVSLLDAEKKRLEYLKNRHNWLREIERDFNARENCQKSVVEFLEYASKKIENDEQLEDWSTFLDRYVPYDATMENIFHSVWRETLVPIEYFLKRWNSK
jgi:hypothetical protein